MTILLKPLYDIEGNVVALGELESGEAASLPGPLEFPDGTTQTTAYTGQSGGTPGALPVGPTEGRPSVPVTGDMRFNTTKDRLEVYGNSFWQLLKYDKEAPPPTIGIATVISNTEATVTFTPHPDVVQDGVTSHTAISVPGGIMGTLEGNGGGTISLVGLTPGERYVFHVYANNPVGSGTYSDPSNQVEMFRAPDAPIIGLAVANLDGSTATINFTAPAYNGGAPVTSYTATANPGGLTSSVDQEGSGSINIPGLSPFIDYTFTVSSTNIYGVGAQSEPSNSIRWDLPDAPVIGTVTIDASTITVPFTPPSFIGNATINTFTVVSIPEGLGTTIDAATSPGYFTLLNALQDVTYTFKVYCTSVIGNSLESEVSNAVTPNFLPTGIILPYESTAAIPTGFDRFATADNRMLLGSGGSFATATLGGDFNVTVGGTTTSAGSHIGPGAGGSYTNYGGSNACLGDGPHYYGDHSHTFSGTATIVPPVRRQLMVKANKDVGKIPSNVGMLKHSASTSVLSRVTGIDNYFMYSSDSLVDLAGSSTASIGVTTASGGTHSWHHSNGQSGFLGYGTVPCYYTGDHTHTGQVNCDSVNPQHKYMALYKSVTDDLVLPKENLIGMWESDTPPKGWAICNGENGTPDLRDYFVKYSDSDEKLNTAGGANSLAFSGTGFSGTPAHNHGNSTAGSVFSMTTYHPYDHAVDTHTGDGSTPSYVPAYYAVTFIMRLV